MLNIYMARHGQDKDNKDGILNGRRDMPLTDLGIEQAELLANKIVGTGIVFDAIYSSYLKRVYATAEKTARALNAPRPIIMNDLVERDFGIMTGKRHEDIILMCSPNIIQAKGINYFLDPEGAETFPEARERGRRIITDIKNRHSDGNILIFTSSDIGKATYASYYGLGWKEVLKSFYFGNGDLLLLSEDSDPEDAHVFKISDSETDAQMKR